MTNALALLAFAAAASALRLAPASTPRVYAGRMRPATRSGPVMAEVDECITDAESAAEAEECAVPIAADGSATRPVPPMAKSDAEKRAGLMGSADSLQSCLSEAEDGVEAEDCLIDYDELVSVPLDAEESAGLSGYLAPALAAAAVCGGAIALLG